jgi:deoxycytidine triphosphate deaminase
MARILADKDIRRLIGRVIVGGEEKLINPNGIELRLGNGVLFLSTQEEIELRPGNFLKITPGESAVISSLELIDFKAETVESVCPGCMLMGLITPTTTMMREGISQVTTKIDAGFRGILNWQVRNGSAKDIILQHGEPIFKLTVFELNPDEKPDVAYGQRPTDRYQDTEGIKRSTRTIPADIPKNKMVASSTDRVDPKKRLQEAGYPFNYIGTELTTLDGKFATVSTDVRMMRDEFRASTADLSEKIKSETTAIAYKLEEERKNILERVEGLFSQKILKLGGSIVSGILLLYGGVNYLEKTAGWGGATVSLIAGVFGIIIFAITLILTARTNKP